MKRLITLTTDFGEGSHYVAQLKASILSVDADARVIDLTHSVPPQDIRHAASLVGEVCLQFPAATIHVVVVDPGVGTDRGIVLAGIAGHDFVAPDNGVLSALTRRHAPDRVNAVTEQAFWRPQRSNTFHGRDIMAPVAAHLSLGIDANRIGPPADGLIELDWSEPTVEDRRITGHITMIDSFGNLISDIPAQLLCEVGVPSLDEAIVECRGRVVRGICRAYGQRSPGELLALFGSSGMLELAVAQGDAARTTGTKAGDTISVSW